MISGVARGGGAVARAPGRSKNALLSRNLDQNMPKNAYFWKKL